MNILDSDALDRLAAVEGEAWRRAQQNDSGPYGFFAYQRAHLFKQNSVYANDPDVSAGDFFQQLGISTGDGTIYGDGGFSRYSVQPDGEVVLLPWSVDHAPRKMVLARENDIRIAGSAGFRKAG